MRKFLPIIAVIFAVIAAPTALRADTMYAVDQALPGGGSITGSITTNGSQGTQGEIEIFSWSFGVSDNGNVGTGNEASAGKLDLSGIDLTANYSFLQFNFSGEDGGELIFPMSNGGYIVWATADCQVCPSIASLAGVSGGFVAAVDIGGDGVADVLSLSGVQTIGTAITPEPPTSGLMLIGIALLGMMIAMRTRMFGRRNALIYSGADER